MFGFVCVNVSWKWKWMMCSLIVNVKTRENTQSKKKVVKKCRVSLRGEKIKKMKQEKKDRGRKISHLHSKSQSPSLDQYRLQIVCCMIEKNNNEEQNEKLPCLPGDSIRCRTLRSKSGAAMPETVLLPPAFCKSVCLSSSV